MKRLIPVLTAATMLVLFVGNALAEGSPWKNHAPPFDFLFQNHIDTHQESKIIGRGKLVGFLYIQFTGETTEDGFSVAKHGNCAKMPEGCTVGWTLHGIPMQATYLGHQAGQHPTWYVDPADVPRQPGYTHFHWYGAPEHSGGLVVGRSYPGVLLRLTAVDRFVFQHHGGFLITPGIDVVSHANVVTDEP